METRPQLTSVACAVPASVQALDHVMERINELLMPETIDAAVYNDCQFVVRIHGATRRWTTKALDGAAARGRLDLVKWLSVVRTEGCTMAAINDATRNGHLEMVKWLCTHYVERCSSEALNAAAINGHIEVVKWLCGRNHGRLAYVMTSGVQAIARTGDTSALRVILRENCCWPHVGRALENAASQGLTDVVKLLLTANVRQANVNRALQNAVVMENVAIVHILTDLCSSSQLQAAYSTAMAGCNTKVIDFLGKTIEGRHVEEKWGYFRTHHKTLERIKTSRERSRIQDKSVSFCGLLRSW